jgi:serine/threonine-protein kinase HipA
LSGMCCLWYFVGQNDTINSTFVLPKYLSNVTLRPAGLNEAGITLDERTASLAELLPERDADVRQVTFQSGSFLKEPGLLIERFDLPRQLPDAEALLFLEDAASLLGLRRREKYRPSLEMIADMLLGLGLDDAGLASFYDHVVFSWIAGNGDLHAKNISVLHLIRPGHLGSAPEYLSVRYSPLYDLLNTRVAIRDDSFALPLNGKQNNLRGKDFIVLARRLGWDRGYALNRLAHVAEGLDAHLEPVIAVSGLSPERQGAYRAIVSDNLRAL